MATVVLKGIAEAVHWCDHDLEL